MNELFKKQNRNELILTVLFAIYLVAGFRLPEPVANLVDTLAGKIIIMAGVVYAFMKTGPILAALSLFVAFDLIRRSSSVTGLDALRKYAPSEENKNGQLTAFNQFPYTLEQEVVRKMAPIVHSGSPLTNASYVPALDTLHDASPL
jgi:hypothetical protein